jgi:predicted nucleic acid-binding protein
MELNDVPDGTIICVDSNILVYHFLNVSPQCSAFLARVAAREISAWTGAHILAEMLHRLMIREATDQGLISGGNPARRLKEHPDIVRALPSYQQALPLTLVWLDQVCPINAEVLSRSASVRATHGLLVNDSLTVTMVEMQGTTTLATADRDFLQVPGLQVYIPSDI